jgi:hypothetical protein
VDGPLKSPSPKEELHFGGRRERWHIGRLARVTTDGQALAGRVDGSSEETAALFDSGYRKESELGEDPRADAP